MSIVLSVNGINYNFPQEGDENWGSDVTNWAQAITLGVLQKSGGLFTLTSEVDFGVNFGLKSVYYKSRGSNIASGGILRLANAELLSWRNAGNTADLSVRVNSSNWLQFNSIDLVDLSTTQTISNKSIGSNLLPSVHNSYDLGSNAVRFKDGYFQGNLTVGGTLAAGAVTFTNLTATGNVVLGDADTDTLSIGAELISNITPDVTNTYDLGSSSKNWRNLYLSGFIRVGDGSAASPSYSFGSETSSGIYRDSGGDISISIGGVGNVSFQTARSRFSSQLQTQLGSASAPSYSFTGDSNTGIYSSGVDSLDFSTGGTQRGSVNSTGVWNLGTSGASVTHVINGSTLNLISSTGLIRSEDALQSITVVDNSTNNVFSITASGNEHIVVEYSITRSTNKETGTILITNDGSTAQHAANSVSIGSVGVVFSSDISAGNVRLRYTASSTGSNGTIKFVSRRWSS